MANRMWVNTAIFFPHSLIISHLMTNSMWVINNFFFQTVIQDQQTVSDTAVLSAQIIVSSISLIDCEWLCLFFLPGRITEIHTITNRLWVTLKFVFFWKETSILWPKGCEWQWRTDLCPDSLITSHPMTNSLWVTLQLLQGSFIMSHHVANSMWVIHNFSYEAVSWHVIPWPIVSEWHCSFCIELATSLHSFHDQ